MCVFVLQHLVWLEVIAAWLLECAHKQLLFEICSFTGFAKKNDPTCFCQNCIKSAPNLLLFGTRIVNSEHYRIM